MSENPAIKIIDGIGVEVLRDRTGMTERNIRHSRSAGRFAAKWYLAIKEVGEDLGVRVPLTAFSFERVELDLSESPEGPNS